MVEHTHNIWLVYMTGTDDDIVHSSIIGYESFDDALACASTLSGDAKAELDVAGDKILGATFNDVDGGQIVQVAKLPVCAPVKTGFTKRDL